MLLAAIFQELVVYGCSARGIFCRALAEIRDDVNIYRRYCRMEIHLKQYDEARQVFRRAMKLLPLAKQLYYDWTFMEQELNNMDAARKIFLDWMKFEPEPQAYKTFINFECKQLEFQRAKRDL